MKKRTLAIFSPAINAYSETFIQAHKKLAFDIKFYYDGIPPSKLEGASDISLLNFFEKIKRRSCKGLTNLEYGLFNSLKKEKVDCVLAEYGPTACASLNLVKYARLPLVVHFHGFDASRRDIISNYGDAYQEVFKYASKVIAVSNKMKEDLLRLGCDSNKLMVTPCGPDPSFFETVPLYNSSQFVSIGRFVDKKGPQLTIKAFKLVTEAFPASTLVMIGEGVLLEECRGLVESLGIKEKVHFAGVFERDKINQVMERSIAFVQHSIVADNGDAEGTPVAVMEAQAAGLPVIATLHAGIPDVVMHDETGLLTAEQDVAGMAGYMMRILSTPGLAERLGKAGKKRVMKNFTLERHLDILNEAIQKAIA